jgi:hypothetical protein
MVGPNFCRRGCFRVLGLVLLRPLAHFFSCYSQQTSLCPILRSLSPSKITAITLPLPSFAVPPTSSIPLPPTTKTYRLNRVPRSSMNFRTNPYNLHSRVKRNRPRNIPARLSPGYSISCTKRQKIKYGFLPVSSHFANYLP